MTPVIQCPNCAKTYAAQPQLVGTKVKCTSCQHLFVAQVVSPAAVAAQPSAVVVGCPHCGQRFRGGSQLIGTQVACPSCQQPFMARPQVAPTAVQQPAAPAAPVTDPLFGAMPLDDGSLGGQGFPHQGSPAQASFPTSPVSYQQPVARKPAKKNSGVTGEFIRGVAGTVFGVVLCLVAIVGSIYSYTTAKDGGKYTIWSGGIVFGLIAAGYGVTAMIRAAQMKAGHVSKSGEAGIDRLGRSIKGWHLLLLIPLAMVVMLVLVFMLG